MNNDEAVPDISPAAEIIFRLDRFAGLDQW
jgi:hypothetical protein